MRKTYKHIFRDGVMAEMTLELDPTSDAETVFVAWTPKFDVNFLLSVQDEYEAWAKASLLDYGVALGRGIKKLTI